MTAPDEFAEQDALDWPEQLASEEDAPAAAVLAMLERATTRENTVIGMCMARRPHSEIRDYLLTGELP